MKTNQKKAVVLLVLTLCVMALVGCDGPAKVIGARPEDRLNPALTAHQRQLRLHAGNN